MASKVSYKASAEADLRRLDKPLARRILGKLETSLSLNPDLGVPLAGDYLGLFKFRMGDYRVIYAKIHDGILVLRVGRRKDIYRRR